MTEQEFAAGYVFFRPGDAGDRAYLVRAGEIELLAGTDELFTRVALFVPGDVFGEMALVEERPRDFTARAVTSGRISPITREEFEHQLVHDPAVTRQYLRSLFERIRILTARLGSQIEPATGESRATQALATLPPGTGRPTSWVVILHPLRPPRRSRTRGCWSPGFRCGSGGPPRSTSAKRWISTTCGCWTSRRITSPAITARSTSTATVRWYANAAATSGASSTTSASAAGLGRGTPDLSRATT